jgi:DNA-binding NarL/FixJ family response regulator
LLEKIAGSNQILLVDYLSLKDFSAQDLIALKAQYTDVRTVAITNDRSVANILGVLEGGVDGFLFKDCGAEEVIRAVKSVGQGDKYFCSRVLEIIMQDRLGNKLGEMQLNELSRREKQIIKLVVEGESTFSIAEKLHLSPHTVSTHRKNINKKLNIRTPVDLVILAYDRGLISK